MNQETPLSTFEALVRLAFTIHARLEARAAQEKVSIIQLRMLGILRDREPTINELTVYLDLDKSSVSGLVDRAERREYVSRFRDDLDRRSVRVRLEPTGRAVVDAASARFEEDVQHVLATLTEAERAQWAGLTTRMLLAEAGELGVTL